MHNTYFTVYPEDCNYLKALGTNIPMVHGGTMLLKMDRAAADYARRLLYNSGCDSALTVGVTDVIFHFGAKLGDLINIVVTVKDVGIKRISFKVECYLEEGNNEKLIAEGIYHFCSFKDEKPFPHGLSMKDEA